MISFIKVIVNVVDIIYIFITYTNLFEFVLNKKKTGKTDIKYLDIFKYHGRL